MDHIILEGFVGCGKGAVGKKVAKLLDLPVIEIDKLVSDKLKMTPADIYDRFGEVYFRALETVVLSEIKNLDGRAVIILGSGLPLLEHNDPYLEELGDVIWLRMSKASLIEKLKRGKKYDWMKDDESNLQISDLLKEREEAYKRIASAIIDVDEMTADEAAAAVIEAAAEKPAKKEPVPEEEPKKKPAAKKKAPAKKAVKKAKEAAAPEEAPKKKTKKKSEEKPAEKIEDKPAEMTEDTPAKKKTAKKTTAKKA